MPTLYVVATPIGNLEDVTLRALRVLGEVGLIAAEDTRVTQRLLHRHQIATPLTSYHEHNKKAKLPRLLDQLARKDVALVTDAGMPGVSDPGSELVAAAAEAGFNVATVPGASAVTSALSVAGLTVKEYVYVGFLPRRRADRAGLLESFAGDRRTLVAFETPHRLGASLRDILTVLGDRRVAACRELTKLHEEVFRGSVSEALEHFASPRGEFTLVIEGAAEPPADDPDQEARALAALAGLRREGVRAREAVASVSAQSGLPRSRVYQLWLATEG